MTGPKPPQAIRVVVAVEAYGARVERGHVDLLVRDGEQLCIGVVEVDVAGNFSVLDWSVD